jgi:hypothetical protein
MYFIARARCRLGVCTNLVLMVLHDSLVLTFGWLKRIILF